MDTFGMMMQLGVISPGNERRRARQPLELRARKENAVSGRLPPAFVEDPSDLNDVGRVSMQAKGKKRATE